MADNGVQYRKLLDYPAHHIVMATMYSAVALVTTALNFLILISIWKTPSLHKPSYILIGSLALSDFLIGITVELLSLVVGMAAQGKGWNEPLCIVWKTGRGLSYWLAAVSLYTLATISLDRLLAIKLRNRYRNIVTLKRVLVTFMPFWIGSLIIILPLFLTLTAQTFAHVLLFFGVAASILISFIAICYSTAFYQLRKLACTVSPTVGNAEAPSVSSSKIDVSKYRKSLKTTFLVFVLIMIFYTPYVFLNGIGTVLQIDKTTFKSEKEKEFIVTIYMFMGVSEFIVVSNSFVNPLMYLWRMSDIRTAVYTTLNKILNLQQ